jgi:hypothetical protein
MAGKGLILYKRRPVMEILNVNVREEKKIETFPYRGKPLKVKDVRTWGFVG